MAVNETTIEAQPEDVFALLADGRQYAEWVVGAKRIRSVDANWPAPGSKFHHAIGVGPLEIQDSSKVLAVDPPRRLVLEVRARPAGVGEVTFELDRDGDGTRVVMRELPTRGLARVLYNPLLAGAVKARNAETLRRLKSRVEACNPR